ncbi:hypothetical protein D770_22875 [Flammeovirgaceae bacterium 311]|nr:hypothetical protein D770_22875 [Flammeovirgaceae bacterium 311]
MLLQESKAALAGDLVKADAGGLRWSEEFEEGGVVGGCWDEDIQSVYLELCLTNGMLVVATTLNSGSAKVTVANISTLIYIPLWRIYNIPGPRR